jgi:hypothetical protein
MDERRLMRLATEADAAFIAEMLKEAASWERPSGEPPCPLADLLAVPPVADCFERWRRTGAEGVVSERNAIARRRCQRAGSIVVGREGDSLTMRLDLSGEPEADTA